MLKNNKNIMIVTNENSLSDTLEERLKDQGYDVSTTFENGDDLKYIIKNSMPDLVVISMSLSCVEGIELSLRIRRWCSIPIILVSSWSETIKAVPQNGKKCQLMKIDTVDEVMTTVESTFSRN